MSINKIVLIILVKILVLVISILGQGIILCRETARVGELAT